jgi:uncharacterized glyoxalase superfamily protein PhnB
MTGNLGDHLGARLASSALDPATRALATESRLDSTSAIALYMEALDLEELYSRLGEAGVKIVDPLADRPWGQAEFTIEDLQGNWLTFWKATEQSE